MFSALWTSSTWDNSLPYLLRTAIALKARKWCYANDYSISRWICWTAVAIVKSNDECAAILGWVALCVKLIVDFPNHHRSPVVSAIWQWFNKIKSFTVWLSTLRPRYTFADGLNWRSWMIHSHRRCRTWPNFRTHFVNDDGDSKLHFHESSRRNMFYDTCYPFNE